MVHNRLYMINTLVVRRVIIVVEWSSVVRQKMEGITHKKKVCRFYMLDSHSLPGDMRLVGRSVGTGSSTGNIFKQSACWSHSFFKMCIGFKRCSSWRTSHLEDFRGLSFLCDLWFYDGNLRTAFGGKMESQASKAKGQVTSKVSSFTTHW